MRTADFTPVYLDSGASAHTYQNINTFDSFKAYANPIMGYSQNGTFSVEGEGSVTYKILLDSQQVLWTVDHVVYTALVEGSSNLLSVKQFDRLGSDSHFSRGRAEVICRWTGGTPVLIE